MLNVVIRYRIVTNRPGGVLNAGNLVSVFWDDVANTLSVYTYDDEFDTSGTLITSGPDLGADRYDFTPITASRPIPYTFCNGTQLNYFIQRSIFPYALKKTSDNHFSCSLAVCDLSISDDYTVVDASDTIANDGSILVTATSSNGPIKFNLNADFNYATEGQGTGLFENLYYGTYTIFARDLLGCLDSIIIEVKVPDFYNVKYRLEYDDQMGFKSRVDILERGYLGEIIEVIGGDDPFVLSYNSNGTLNKFNPIVPSSAKITLIADSNFYFRDLFSQDDRKYQVRFYKDFATVIPGFVPAELPDFKTWSNLNDAGPSWGIYAGVANPIFTGLPYSDTSALGLNVTSDKWYSAYSFVAGAEYSFGYGFSVKVTKIYTISILDDDMNVLLSTNINATSTGFVFNGTTGIYTFIAPAGAAGISIHFYQSASCGAIDDFCKGFITSFTNLTESTPSHALGFEMRWIGFAISSNYQEPYVASPYPVVITATDGLADIDTFDFVDEFGNKFKDDILTLKSICEILKKTNLNINVISAVNRFEQGMTQDGSSDPFTQCKFDPSIFYNSDGTISSCSVVLSEILKPFGARLLQRNAKWFIVCIEEMVHSVASREFDYTGEFIQSEILRDISNIEFPSTDDQRALLINHDQTLEIIPTYGYFFFIYKLLQNASLVKSYSFEAEDLTDDNIVQSFKNWNINISLAPGATYGIKKTKSFEGIYNFFYKIYRIGVGVRYGELVLTAAQSLIEYDANDSIEFRFNLAVILGTSTNSNAIPPVWIKIKWSIKVGDYYLNNGTWTNDEDYKYNDLYVEAYNNPQEFKIVVPLRNVEILTLETFQVEFVLASHETMDFISEFGDYNSLKEITTANKNVGTRIKGHLYYTNSRASTAEKTLYWVLIDDNAVTNGIETVRPNDYDSDTNQKVWQLEDSILTRRTTARGTILNDFPSPELPVSYVYMDNVVLRHLPNGSEPPDNITIEKLNNQNIKENFEETYLLNDIDIDNINNSERTYKNYFKLLDGSPAQIWTRTYRAGSDKLLSIFSNDFSSQYRVQSNKLTGSLISDLDINAATILNEVNDANRKYMFMTYDLHDKIRSINFDLAELKDVVNNDRSDGIDAGYTTGFTLGYRA